MQCSDSATQFRYLGEKEKRLTVDVEVGGSNQTEMFCLFHSEVSVVAMVTKQNLSEKVKYKQLTVI